MTAVEVDIAGLDEEPAALSDAYRGAPPADAWLARRTHAWGGSEVPVLLAAYGLAPLSACPPRWLTDQAQDYKRIGIPRFLAWKSGLRARPSGGESSTAIKDRGNARELELLRRFRDSPIAARRIDPKKVRHARQVPREWFPLVDRHCHRLAVTPDAWARDLEGRLVAIELKCTFGSSPGGLKWHHAAQLQAEVATMAAHGGLLVEGERWVDDSVPDGPIRVHAMGRDEALIDLTRAVCLEAWDLVEGLRAIAEEVDALGSTAADKRHQKDLAANAAASWAASRERLAPRQHATRRALEGALAELEDFAA